MRPSLLLPGAETGAIIKCFSKKEDKPPALLGRVKKLYSEKDLLVK